MKQKRLKNQKLSNFGFVLNYFGLILIAISCAPKEADEVTAYKFEIVFDSERDGSTEVYVLDLDTREVLQLTNSPDLELFSRLPDWSPDGKQIVFVSNRDGGKNNLYIMNADGSNVRQLTHGPGTHGNPAWSPQADVIAFEMEQNGVWRMYLINIDGSGQRPIGPLAAYHPSWSPDGEEIAFITEKESSYVGAIMKSDGTEVREITDIEGGLGSIKLSPDGRRIAFDAVLESNFDIYVMNSDGSNLRRLTDDPAVDARPEWSPDGQEIVFHTTRDYGSVGGSEKWEEFELYVMDLKDLSIRRLTENKTFDAHPDWCPQQ